MPISLVLQLSRYPVTLPFARPCIYDLFRQGIENAKLFSEP